MFNLENSNEHTPRLSSFLEKVRVTDGSYSIEESRDIKTDQVSKSSFIDNRKRHRPDLTADFLALFSVPSGFKFLTHDFDPNSDITMADVISRANETLNSKKFRFKIPGSLYSLINNFINKGNWKAYTNSKREFFLKNPEITEWINKSPSLHPLTHDEFGKEINLFRDTVRISKPHLTNVFKRILNYDSLKLLHTKTEKLDTADFYTNVFWMTYKILFSVMRDIAQREETADVNIKYIRSSHGQYRLCSIIITHIGSEANPFEDVKTKLKSGGGALFNLMSACTGYCDWTIEGNFEGEYKRWRILDSRDLPEEEDLQPNEVEGFTHIFTFYKSTTTGNV